MFFNFVLIKRKPLLSQMWREEAIGLIDDENGTFLKILFELEMKDLEVGLLTEMQSYKKGCIPNWPIQHSNPKIDSVSMDL